jgi:hypothetical protein
MASLVPKGSGNLDYHQATAHLCTQVEIGSREPRTLATISLQGPSGRIIFQLLFGQRSICQITVTLLQLAMLFSHTALRYRMLKASSVQI